MEFWEGFEKQAGKYTDYAANVGTNAAVGGGAAALINALSRGKYRVDAKGSAILSGALSALLGLPGLMRKEGAYRMRLGSKGLNSGNRPYMPLTARPIPLKATAGSFKPTPLPSATAPAYKPSQPKAKVPSKDKLKPIDKQESMTQ